MYSRLREHFSATALILSVAAVVLALAGGALAANGGATASKSKAGPRGKTGKTGPPGPAGTNGTNGTNGKDGAPGTNGKDGTDGTNAEAISFTGSKGTCTENQGGLEVKSASATTYVCNGKKGTNGTSAEATSFTAEEEENGNPAGEPCELRGGLEVLASGSTSYVCNGSPWAAGGTLPSGATETGDWFLPSVPLSEATGAQIPISFNIPLAASLAAEGCQVTEPGGPFVGPCHVHYIDAVRLIPEVGQPPKEVGKEEVVTVYETFGHEEQPSSECKGSVAEPTAAPGNLCIYAANDEHSFTEGGNTLDPSSAGAGAGAGTVGAILQFRPTGEGEGSSFGGFGTWAVTAP